LAAAAALRFDPLLLPGGEVAAVHADVVADEDDDEAEEEVRDEDEAADRRVEEEDEDEDEVGSILVVSEDGEEEEANVVEVGEEGEVSAANSVSRASISRKLAAAASKQSRHSTSSLTPLSSSCSKAGDGRPPSVRDHVRGTALVFPIRSIFPFF
jgi:hypothetical protein